MMADVDVQYQLSGLIGILVPYTSAVARACEPSLHRSWSGRAEPIA